MLKSWKYNADRAIAMVDIFRIRARLLVLFRVASC
jgi:hypothetical protein